MFTVNDFIKLMKYFKTRSTEDLDKNLIIQAEDSKAKSINLFNDNLDLVCHSSNDYKRLKNFLVPWYASLRTFVSVMRNASDVRSLPDEHLNELIRSFGFTESLREINHLNKIDFFYDLVNLYKIKGTPESIIRSLSFYGISNIEFSEYWLQFDENGKLVFHPEIITTNNSKYYQSRDIDFNHVIEADPHWMLTEEQILQLFSQNKIAFPSKSPYFGIKPISEGSGSIIIPTLAILSRLVQDEYLSHISGVKPVKNISSALKILLSIIDLYLGIIYSFNVLYHKEIDSNDTSFLIYNGSMDLSNDEIFDLYKTITERSSSQTRDELKENRILFQELFTRDRETNFLKEFDSAKDVLIVINPELKHIIDTYTYNNNTQEVLKILLNDLTAWLKLNIVDNPQDMTIYLLGFTFLDYATKLVNFFKPYRARLIPTSEHAYIIENPLMDSVIPEDSYSQTILSKFIDWDVANSEPGYLEDFLPEGTFVTSTPPNDDCRRITDLFIDSTGIVKCNFIDTTSWTNIESKVYSEPAIGQYRILNIYLYDKDDDKFLYVDFDDIPESIGGIKSEIKSNPPPGFYTINDVYLNNLSQFEIVYNNQPIVWPIDSTARIYFSRELYDTGSFFDIGASIDQDEHEDGIEIKIKQENHVIYNYHEDSTACTNILFTGNLTGNKFYAQFNGGFYDFDDNGVFDAPQISDIFKVYIENVALLTTSVGETFLTHDGKPIYIKEYIENVTLLTTSVGETFLTHDRKPIYIKE